MSNKFEKKGDVVVGVVGIRNNPNGSKDFSRAINLMETDEDRERAIQKQKEALKIPDSVKSGTPDMVYMNLRNAVTLARDAQTKEGFQSQIRLLSRVKNNLTKKLLEQSLRQEKGSMTRDKIKEKIDSLSTDDMYDLLQKEIDSNELELTSSKSEEGTEFFKQEIKVAEDLQQRLLQEGLNRPKEV